MVYPNCKYIAISVSLSQDNDLFKDVNLSCLFFFKVILYQGIV